MPINLISPLLADRFRSTARGKLERQQAVALLREGTVDPGADFREGPWEAIDRLVRRRERLLVVQRTGWGKSVVYFLATHRRREQGAGPTLLICPLLSLMRDQVRAARRLGLSTATINSTNFDEWEEVFARLRADSVDVLIVSPERLADDTFRSEFLNETVPRLGMLVVDEAHCISDWGHDFRPDYLRLGQLVQKLPRDVPVLATTATANQRVVDDVRSLLGKRMTVVRGPLARDSLAWVTCVPSLNHPTLVPDLASRLAAALDLPFLGHVKKLRTIEPQKQMENDHRQTANLAGAFAVEAAGDMGGPVLLVDDIVVSRWTFTIVGALLRASGSGPVYPLALAVSTRTADG